MGNEKKINSQIIKFVDDNTKELVSAYRVFQKKDGSNLVFILYQKMPIHPSKSCLSNC